MGGLYCKPKPKPKSEPGSKAKEADTKFKAESKSKMRSSVKSESKPNRRPKPIGNGSRTSDGDRKAERLTIAVPKHGHAPELPGSDQDQDQMESETPGVDHCLERRDGAMEDLSHSFARLNRDPEQLLTFFDLPPEIRNQIYDLSGCTTLWQCTICRDTVRADRRSLPKTDFRNCERYSNIHVPLDGWDSSKYTKPVIHYFWGRGQYDTAKSRTCKPPDITRVCSQMRHETLPMFYGNRHWYYEAFHDYMNKKCMVNIHMDLLKWVDAIGPVATGMIRNLTVLYNKGIRRAHDIEFSMLPALRKRGLREGVLEWRSAEYTKFEVDHLKVLLQQKPAMTEQDRRWHERRRLGLKREYKTENCREDARLREWEWSKMDEKARRERRRLALAMHPYPATG